MSLSRLRLRLAAWFTVAFVLGLTTLNLALYAYLRQRSGERLTQNLHDGAADLAHAIQFEYQEHPADGLANAAREALVEWTRPGVFIVYTEDGSRVMARGDMTYLRHMPVRLDPADTGGVVDVVTGGAHSLRQVTVAAKGTPRFFVRVSGSTQPIHDETKALALWLGLTTPIVLVLSLVGGYILSRHALTPIERLGHAVATIAPDELDHRLPVRQPPDEIDRLAAQFNGVLERLQQAGQQNRRFVQQAAHQIRTPLTLVLGEAELSLDRPRTPDEQHQALERIRTAATQMKRRVDELLLLAQAEAGERPALNEVVELDGLVLECADLMRARAHRLGQRLELLRAEPISVWGNEALLKEAVLELIENACRYGTTEHPIGISAFGVDQSAYLHVVSSGAPAPMSAPVDAERAERVVQNSHRSGLGLTIVRWIASEHGGTLTYEREAGRNIYQLVLPTLSND